MGVHLFGNILQKKKVHMKSRFVFRFCKQPAERLLSIVNKTKDQLWSLNAAQPVGNLMFKME